jgi:magnesium transporter
MRYAFAMEADAGMLRDVTPGSGQVTAFAAPTEVEQQELHDAMGIDDHTIASALDPEEISRLEVDAATERITIIWKRPGSTGGWATAAARRRRTGGRARLPAGT